MDKRRRLACWTNKTAAKDYPLRERTISRSREGISRVQPNFKHVHQSTERGNHRETSHSKNTSKHFQRVTVLVGHFAKSFPRRTSFSHCSRSCTAHQPHIPNNQACVPLRPHPRYTTISSPPADSSITPKSLAQSASIVTTRRMMGWANSTAKESKQQPKEW